MISKSIDAVSNEDRMPIFETIERVFFKNETIFWQF